MKTIIITTKKDDNCYERIRTTWFKNIVPKSICISPNVANTAMLPEYCIVYIKKSGDYRVCLPECLNPHLPQKQRVEYLLSLICSIIYELSIQKKDVYLVLHSGDLFDMQDARRRTGSLPFNWLNCTSDLLNRFCLLVEEKHMYQFRHDDNDVSDLLLYSTDEEISSLCQSIIKIIDT